MAEVYNVETFDCLVTFITYSFMKQFEYNRTIQF